MTCVEALSLRQSLVYRVKRKGEITVPWGAPVLICLTVERWTEGEGGGLVGAIAEATVEGEDEEDG